MRQLGLVRFKLQRRTAQIVGFLLIFLFRFAQFGESLTSFQQDEINYYNDFVKKSFTAYLITPDAGYPIPGLRLITWTLFSISSDPRWFHAAITAISTAFLLLPLVLPMEKDEFTYFYFSMLLLGMYWSDDLLMGQNLPYYLAIPVLMMISRKSGMIGLSTSAALFIAAFFVSKPQILLLVLYVLLRNTFIHLTAFKSRFKLAIAILVPGTYAGMLLIGRIGESSLDLRTEPSRLLVQLAVVPFSASAHLVPIMPLSLAGINYFDIMPDTLWQIFSWIIFLLVSLLILWMMNYARQRIYVWGLTFVAIVPLLAFPNSGWSIYSPSSFLYFPIIHQRHDFFVLAVLLLMVIPLIDKTENMILLRQLKVSLLGLLFVQETLIIIAYKFFPSLS